MVIVVTANIGRTGMSPYKVLEDFRKIKSLDRSPRKDNPLIINFQEIDEADPANEHRLMRKVFPHKDFRIIGFDTRIPVVLSKQLKLVANPRIKLVHQGNPRVSPPRWCIDMALKDLEGNEFDIFGNMNSHSVAGAFNANEHQKDEPWRDEMWQRMWEYQDRRIDSYMRRSISMFRSGDDNRPNTPKHMPRENQLHSQGIDTISFFPANSHFQVTDKGTVELNSDHNAKFVVGRLVRRRAD